MGLREYLAMNGHRHDLEDHDIRLLIDRFDRDNDGLIGLHEVSIDIFFVNLIFLFYSLTFPDTKSIKTWN